MQLCGDLHDTKDIPQHGEGNHDADADCRARTQEFIANEDVEALAEEAAEALEAPEEGPEPAPRRSDGRPTLGSRPRGTSPRWPSGSGTYGPRTGQRQDE